jgi:4-diphosphocytidyl-2-C-methyl-D-erythritol kinase
LGAVDAVSFLAPAKLNLSLQVFGKRPDGYHHIRSVMVPVSLYDEVTVEKAPDGISVACDDPSVPTDEGNSCRQAAALFMAWAGEPAGARIRLRKAIPAESGLGGGSSDAAATLKALSVLAGRCPSPAELLGMASRVGADVPFFTLGRAALVEGFGDRLTPIPWGVAFHAVIVRPPFGLPTREGYERLRRPPGDPPPPAGIPEFRTLGDVAAGIRNDFEEAWEAVRPEIGEIRRDLLAAGALAAGLSGSGSAVFGLFASAEAARAARGKLPPGNVGGAVRRVFVVRSV